MSEETVEEKPVAKKAPAKKTSKPRATKKAAESAPVEVLEVNVEESTVVNDEGQEVITGPAKAEKPARVSNMHAQEETNTVASRAADSALKRKVNTEKPKDDSDKVALWSDRNMRWSDVGAVTKGYNIVTKEAAEKWLTKTGIRKATPEEVATYYGK